MSDDRWAGATVAAIDIARLAGVGKAAVGNWRRRFADFPEPVAGTASSPLYRLGDVERWLTHHGRAIRVSAADRVWQWLRTETDDLRLGELIGHLGAFLVYLDRQPESWKEVAGASDGEFTAALGRAVAAAVPELPGGLPELPDPEFVSALRTIADVVAEQGAASTFEFLVERYLDAHARRIQPTPAETADVIVRLAQVTDRSVLDPACGTGALLAAAAAAGATSVAGQDSDQARTRITGARLLLAGGAVEMASGDPLLSDGFAGHRFGAVVCNPSVAGRDWGYDELAGDPRWEYGLPPRGEPELAWAQHCLAHTEPGGLAVIVMPPAVAVRRPGRRIRGNLLRAGALRAVVSLRLDAGGTSDLWVLQRPPADETPPAHVLMLVADDPTAVPRLWTDFCADPAAGDTPQSRAVRIIDLLDEDVDVSAARHLPSSPVEDEIDYGRAREDLIVGLRGLADALPDLTVPNVQRELPMTTVGELAKAGMVTLAQAPLRMAIDEGELPVLTVKDVTAGRPPTGRTTRQPGLVTLKAGDVVAPVLAKETRARVITDDGAVLGPRLVSFRVDPERLDPHFLAGFLYLSGAAPGSRTTTGRTDVRRIAIPRLPIEEQRVYGTALGRLNAFQDSLRRSASAGETLVRLALTGLADGTLDPGR
jgi:SAM-dependent methyltransferase